MFVYACLGNERLLLATEILTLGKFYPDIIQLQRFYIVPGQKSIWIQNP